MRPALQSQIAPVVTLPCIWCQKVVLVSATLDTTQMILMTPAKVARLNFLAVRLVQTVPHVLFVTIPMAG